MPNIGRRQWLKSVVTTLVVAPRVHCTLAKADQQRDVAGVVDKGRAFLASLFDAELNLLPEYRGANVYWLYHDDYLAAKVMKSSHPEVAGN